MVNRRRVLRLASLAIVSGCERDHDSDRALPRIAFVMKTCNNPFFNDMQKGAEEVARRLGVELVVQSPEREIDVERQMQIVDAESRSLRISARRSAWSQDRPTDVHRFCSALFFAATAVSNASNDSANLPTPSSSRA